MARSDFMPISKLKEAVKQGYAWPGGYTIIFVTTDGGVLCRACVKKEWRLVLWATKHADGTGGWGVAGADLLEGGETALCDNCGKEIE